MSNTITNTDIISAITVYITSNERPCPMDYLVSMFNNKKTVQKIVNDLKDSGTIIGKRGRTGGLAFPEGTAIAANPVTTDNTATDNDNSTEQDGMNIVEIPF